MKIDVTSEIDIDRPRSEVARFAADPDNATTWYDDIKSVFWETPRPLQVGSRTAFVATSSAASSPIRTSSASTSPACGW